MGTTTNAPKRYTSAHGRCTLVALSSGGSWKRSSIQQNIVQNTSNGIFMIDIINGLLLWFLYVLFRLIRGQNLAVDTINTYIYIEIHVF